METSSLWLDWQPATAPKKRRWGRRGPDPRALVLDLSLSGARVVVEDEAPLRAGEVVAITVDGATGHAKVRRSEPGEGGTIYGIQFLRLPPQLQELVNAEVSVGRGDLEERWLRSE